MATYKALLTTAGAAKIAAATAGGTQVKITHMAVGNGGGKLPTPDPKQTKLVNEVYRANLNRLSIDAKNSNYLVAELVIQPDVGGFWMREMGLYDADGVLVAVSNMAESYKPQLAEGSGRLQTLRMVLIVSEIDAVALSIDGSTVMATKDYVDDKLAAHEKSRNHPDGTLTDKGFVRLSNSFTSDSESLAATPKAVKAANDNANGRLPSDGTAQAASKLATARKIAGVDFDGTKDISITAAGVGALPAAGTAAAATKLATARKIAGVDFDGTKDISITAAGVGAFPAQGGTVGSDGVSTPYLAVTGRDWMTKNGNYASGNDYQTNWTRINGRSSSDAKVDVYHYESTGHYHSLNFHVFGGGNEGYFNHRNDGTFFCTGALIGAAATANEHAVNLAQLNAAVARRALLAGSTVQTFDVAQAASWGHAVRLDQFQSGSNGNGAWVKLPNGPQWCRQNLSLPANTTTTWTFPAGFSGTPALFISTFNGELKAWFNGASGSGANIYNASNSALNVNLLAIW